MNKVMKSAVWGIGILVVLVIGAVIVVPMVVDVKQYKPQIEELVAQKAGRPFSMGEEIDLSVFPWVGVKLTDLVLGSGPGFTARDMVRVKSFEVRLKVMPLLSGQVEVDSFVLETPQIFMEKNKAGKGNWENIPPAGTGAKSAPAEESGGDGSLPIKSLMVGRVAIVDGLLSFSDAGAGTKNEITGLNLSVTDISLDRPVTLSLSAMVDGKPLSLEGTAGPLGRNPGKENMNLDLAVKALNELVMKVNGTLILAGKSPGLDADITIDPFSPKALFKAMGQEFPVKTRDPKVLEKVAVKTRVKGNADALSLSGGSLTLDDSSLTFSAGVKEFQKPDIRFDLALDAIDLDRYLPPPSENPQGTDSGNAGTVSKGDAAGGTSGTAAKTDYAPLRKLVLDGKAAIGTLKAANLTMTDIKVVVTGKNGVFNLDPFSMALYQGTAKTTAQVDVRTDTPATRVNLTTQGVQAGPLVRDGAGKDIIEGTLAADLALAMNGDTPAQIRETFGGKGLMTFTDGAIVGIDIAGTIRNAAAGLGVGEKPSEKPKTDFAELKIPYTAEKGLVEITGASLASPLLRLGAQGKTHLVREDLDFRIDPKLVATLKGQGDSSDRSGLLIPLLVTGTWESPKIRPDLKGMVKKQMANPEGIKQIIEGKDASGQPVSTEEKAKGLIKGLFN